MGVKTFAISLLLIGAAGALWHYKDAPSLRSATASVASGATSAAAKAGLSDIAATATNATPTASGLRKCVKGDAVSYVDTPCPAGSKEQPIRKDLVTVVPGQAPPQPAAQNAATPGQPERPKTVMEMLVPPEKGESLKEKMMNRAIGQ